MWQLISTEYMVTNSGQNRPPDKTDHDKTAHGQNIPADKTDLDKTDHISGENRPLIKTAGPGHKSVHFENTTARLMQRLG
jgi:hypothetical protein